MMTGIVHAAGFGTLSDMQQPPFIVEVFPNNVRSGDDLDARRLSSCHEFLDKGVTGKECLPADK